jgi:predicted dehydrogenase
MPRRLRLGMVGGGPGAFIGAVHRMAARLDDRFELVAGAFSSDPDRSRTMAGELHLDPARAYADFTAMAAQEAARADPVDLVAIVTPNHLHHAPAALFLRAGIAVLCDKPLCHTLEDALDLQRVAGDTLFALAHVYTGYPMIRQARAMIAAGELGEIRSVQVEYAQDWLATPLENTGQKQASWRTDPARSGLAGCVGDIGSHAFNLVEFVTGLPVASLAADLSRFVPGRRLDDDANMLLRFEGGARGALWCSQIATGCGNALRLRVFGDRAGLEWAQETPETLRFTELGLPPQTIARGGAGANATAGQATRLPGGHPEGYLEAFAQLYRDVAEQLQARLQGRAPDPACLLVPGLDDGIRGMHFIAAAVASSRADAAWTGLATA